MKRLGSDMRDIRVALGPSIGACCFEVGDEVVQQFRSLLGDVVGLIVDGPHKKHVNLRLATRIILAKNRGRFSFLRFRGGQNLDLLTICAVP